MNFLSLSPETWAAIVGARAGVLSSFLLDGLRELRRERRERGRTRVLLAEEIAYDWEILARVRAEVDHAGTPTGEMDSYGHARTLGAPVQALLAFHPDQLSRDIWDAQLEALTAALDERELAACFGFYSELRVIADLQARFRESLDNPNFHLATVATRIRTLLAKGPPLPLPAVKGLTWDPARLEPGPEQV